MGNSKKASVRIIAQDSLWVESESIRQLEYAANLEGMIEAIGMPDIHPGKGYPIGAAFLSSGVIYPYLVGNDIGCGMSFWQSDKLARKVKLDKLESKFKFLESFDLKAQESWLNANDLGVLGYANSIGTIGGGNHFAEIQVVNKVYDPIIFENLKLDKRNLFFVVHSGSRGLGADILREYVDKFRDQGVDPNSDEGKYYLEKHDLAVKWASVNRRYIAQKILECIGVDGELVIESCHNSVTSFIGDEENYWVHRKGVNPSNKDVVLIPGSRGTLSYLVRPTGEGRENLFSLPHGAGRKWKRGECKARLDKNYSINDLKRTKLNSRVICSDKELLYEEAPEAYKNIDHVIDTLVNHGLVEIIASFNPLITYKRGG